jgi:hypothetical protein
MARAGRAPDFAELRTSEKEVGDHWGDQFSA